MVAHSILLLTTVVAFTDASEEMTSTPQQAAVVYASFKVKPGCLQCLACQTFIASNRNVLWLA